MRVGLGLGPIWYMDFTTKGRRRGKMDKISSPSESLERKKKMGWEDLLYKDGAF